MLKRLLIALALFTVAVTPVLAGQLVLHPSGFGDHSYSAWKAQEGLPDSRGNDFQALYFQKMVPTATFAAGIAVIKGLEGVPASQLTGLSWDHRTDGHCGAGAPRWNVNLRNATTGQNFTVFLGCFAAPVHTALTATDPGNHTWCRDAYPSSAIASAILAQTGQQPASLALRNLVIVFDEGPEIMLPEPPGCPPAPPAGGFVYLDNITVEVNGTPHVWTGASDNGNGQTIASSPTGVAYLEGLLGESLSIALPPMP